MAGLDGFEGRASVRTWLYRIATNRCLNAVRNAERRPRTTTPAGMEPPTPTRLGEVPWLEPYPDMLLDELPDPGPGPEARHEAREAISLAFVTALQVLPPRQRAALVLREVLSFPASEVAGMLDVTESAVTSALARARSAIARHRTRNDEPDPGPDHAAAPPNPRSHLENRVVEALTRAVEDADVPAIVALLTEDVWMTMPPMPLEYRGQKVVHRFLDAVAFPPGRGYRTVATRANRQPALGIYLHDPHTGEAHANGVWVLTLAGDHVAAITRFDTGALAHLGLPRRLPPPPHADQQRELRNNSRPDGWLRHRT